MLKVEGTFDPRLCAQGNNAHGIRVATCPNGQSWIQSSIGLLQINWETYSELWHRRRVKLEESMFNILRLDAEFTNLCSIVHWCGRAAESLVIEKFSDQQRTWLSPCALHYSAGIQQTRGYTNDPFPSIMDPQNWSPVSNHLWLVSPTLVAIHWTGTIK